MEALIPLIVQLVGGGAGGNVIAQIVKKVDLGPMGNSIVGAVGGLAGTWLAGQIPGLDALVGGGAAAGGMDLGALVGTGATGLVSGGVLTGIVGFIKSSMSKA